MSIFTDEEYRNAHNALQRLWTKAVGTADYDKEEWKHLEATIEILVKRSSISRRY